MRCYKHNNMEATAVCSSCGNGLCAECSSYFQPPACADCVKQRAKETKSKMIKSISLSIILMIAGIFLIQNPLGFVLAGIPSGWRFLNKITPAIFLWMPIIGWVFYFLIKFSLAYFIGIIVLPIELYRDIRDLKNAKKLEDHAHKIIK